jgi:uncharacterized ferritin-like protein (DUF455 family)
MDFFKTLETILSITLPSEKGSAFKAFYEAYEAGRCVLHHQHEVLVFDEPSYTGYCQLVSPAVVLKRKKLSTDRGKAIFLHAVAHIEYSAIDLALDAAYRFRNMPQRYYDDWLSVASDEVRHFEMLEVLLAEVGSYYGDIPVHNGLFEASQKTQLLHERMAVVPRYLEANGLDATPVMIEKLGHLENDEKAEKIIDVLKVILEEECDHVYKGDVWFKYACDVKGLGYEVYFDIIDVYYPGSFPRKKELNIQARQDAGFSCSELKRMNTQAQCKQEP